VPDVGVLFEEVFEALGQAQLAAAVEAGGAEGGDQGGHGDFIARRFWKKPVDMRLGFRNAEAQDCASQRRRGALCQQGNSMPRAIRRVQSPMAHM
jgi:hypothetical protein